MVDYEALILVSAENARNEQGRLFPQPSGYVFYTIVGIILSSLPTLNTSQPSSRTIWASLTPSFSSFTIQHRLLDSIGLFSQDLLRRFEPDNEMDEILDPGRSSFTVSRVAFKLEGLGGRYAIWHGVISGLKVLHYETSAGTKPRAGTAQKNPFQAQALCLLTTLALTRIAAFQPLHRPMS